MKKLKQLRSLFREKLMKPRGLMTAVILLAVSAAVIAGVTLAWYDSFKETQTENLVLKSEGQLVSVDGYKIFTSGGVESTLPSGNTIKLKSYDSVFGKNSETPMYILIPVRGQAVQEAGHTLSFTFACGDNALMDETDATKIKPLFSNVAQLRYVTVAANEVPADYETAQEKFYEITDSPLCFADFTVDSDTHAVTYSTKSSTVTLSMPGYSDSGVQYVLYELDYNFKLVTGFVDNYASGIADRLDQTQNLEFNQDTIYITVSAS